MTGAADRARRRHHRPSARARPDRRHARPQHLDPRRHLGARAAERRDDESATRTCSTSGRRPRGSTTSRSRSGRRRRRTSAARIPIRERPISYWLKRDAGERASRSASPTSPVAKSARSTAPKDAGINRVQWDLRANPPARGTPRAGGAGKSAGGRPSGTGTARIRPPVAPPARGGQGAQGQPTPAPPAAAPQPGGGGRGRGNVGPAAGRALPAEADRRWQDDRDEDGRY